MKVTQFAPSHDLIIVQVRVWSRAAHLSAPLSMVLDTGASETTVVPHKLDELGYSPRDGEQITSVRSAIGKEQGYTLRVARFEALGYAIRDFPIHVFDLAEGLGIDGLIGLSFLRQFNYEVRSREGRILVDRCAA